MSKDLLVLKSLLQKYHPNEFYSFFSYFSFELQDKLRNLPTRPEEILNFNRLDWVKNIHYSWINHYTESSNAIEKQLIDQIFNKKNDQQKHHQHPPSLFIEEFCLYFLSNKIQKEEKKILSPTFLPPSLLQDLLNLSKKELVLLIDFLGIFELAIEIKKIIDRTLLQKIFSALNDKQKQFLEYCKKQPFPPYHEKMQLNNWDGDSKTLLKILHQQGLKLFANALFEEHPDFVWHITHRLDIGRGQAILKIMNQANDSNLIYYFKEQIVIILKLIRKTEIKPKS